MTRTIPSLALAMLLASQAGMPQARAQSLAITGTDRSFLQDQAQGTAYELAIAKLAEQKAVQPAVKQYAQTIVADHDALNRTLAELARFKSITLPDGMGATQRSELARLQALSGPEFDQAYVKETTRINKEDKSQDQEELSKTADPAVKAFVEQLREADAKHFQMGEQLQSG